MFAQLVGVHNCPHNLTEGHVVCFHSYRFIDCHIHSITFRKILFPHVGAAFPWRHQFRGLDRLTLLLNNLNLVGLARIFSYISGLLGGAEETPWPCFCSIMLFLSWPTKQRDCLQNACAPWFSALMWLKPQGSSVWVWRWLSVTVSTWKLSLVAFKCVSDSGGSVSVCWLRKVSFCFKAVFSKSYLNTHVSICDQEWYLLVINKIIEQSWTIV